MFEFLEDMVVQTAAGVRPPERLTVSEAAVKYRKLNNPGSYVGDWTNEMTAYLQEPMDLLNSVSYQAMIFVGPAQSGKRLDLETPIPTPFGWIRFGDIEVNDLVYGPDGEPVIVTKVTEVVENTTAYRVVFDDDEEVICDAEHDWNVHDCRGSDPYAYVKRTTEQLSSTYEIATATGRRFRYAIPVTAPLSCEERALPIEPYLFGLWLGDGHRQSGSLTLGVQDVEELAARVGGDDRGPANTAGTARRVVVEGLCTALRLMGQGSGVPKFIPASYQRASIAQRRALLQGLMDTDGSLDKQGRAEFASSFPGLADSVYELMVGLGLKVGRDDRIPVCQTGEASRSYRLTFTPQDPEEVFRLRRHIDRREEFASSRTTRPTHSGRRFIRKIERVETRPMRCIGVDNKSHLYLCGRGMIPTHNTDMYLNWQTHTVICDPADMMLIQTSQITARDFSKRRIDRLHRHSKDVGSRLIVGRNNDNTFDKRYNSGMMVTLSWPAINELSGKPVPRLWLTDYDRMPQDIDGEGNPFDLARKRATSFRSHGMCAAESSPGFVVDNTRWIPSTPHEAPPTKGILALYNRGDRRRWYWRCVSCKHAFEPDFNLISYPASNDHVEAAEAAVLACPRCGQVYHHGGGHGAPSKYELNAEHSKWVKDGMIWTPEGDVTGKSFRSDIGSFWMKGAAAAFQDWKGLVLNYLKAHEEYEKTGDQGALKTTVNVDQGNPYVPKNIELARLPETLKERAEPLGLKVVPDGGRFLLACIDIQKHKFVVQVHSLSHGGDIAVIDRFDIQKSKRVEENDPTQFLWVNPGAYAEDWHLLIQQVLLKTYPLGDGSGRRMMVKMTFCDSGGSEGVTTNAYAFYRHLRDNTDETLPPNLHGRFQLIKGSPLKGIPRVQLTYPDSQRKDRLAEARGEIPVIQINSNSIKDTLDKRLDRTDRGGGRISFADWLPDNFYIELTVETRTAKGWENLKNFRNESWDLLAYCIAGSLTLQINVERPGFWIDPPLWAEEWDQNDLVFDPVEKPLAITAERKVGSGLASLAERLA